MTVPRTELPPPIPEAAFARERVAGALEAGDGDGWIQPTRGSRPPMRIKASVIVLAAVLVLVSTAAAWWAGSRGPTVHGAEAAVMVQVGDGVGEPEAELRLSTQLVVLTGGKVLGAAAEELGMSPQELRRRLDAEVIQGSQVIRVQASAGSPERAKEILDAVLASYLDQPADQDLDESRRFLSGELDRVAASTAELRRQLAGTADPNSRADLQGRVQQADQRAQTLQEQLTEVQLEGIKEGRPTIVTPSRAMESPLAPTPARSAALGAISGLLVAAVLVLWALRAGRGGPHRS